MGVASSEEGCSICGVRGKQMDMPGRPQPMRLTMQPPGRMQYTEEGRSRGPRQSYGGGPLAGGASPGRPCASPLPPSETAYGPVIDSLPIGSPIPPFGDNISSGITEEDEWDHRSLAGSNASYNAELEIVRKELAKVVKKQEHANRHHQQCGAISVATSTRTAQVVAPIAMDALVSSPPIRQISGGQEFSERQDGPARLTTDSMRSMLSVNSQSEKERAELSDDQLTDLRYSELKVAERLRVFRSNLHGRRQPMPPKLDSSSATGQLKSRNEIMLREVSDYQDAVKYRLGRITTRDKSFSRTVDPAVAVKEGVTRYYETCGDVGTLEPEQLLENPDMDHWISPEERALLDANVAHLQDRGP